MAMLAMDFEASPQGGDTAFGEASPQGGDTVTGQVGKRLGDTVSGQVAKRARVTQSDDGGQDSDGDSDEADTNASTCPPALIPLPTSPCILYHSRCAIIEQRRSVIIVVIQ